MAERSLTGGLSLLELKRQREKLDKVIVQEEENVAKHKALRERDRVKQHGKVLVPPSPVKDKPQSKINWDDPTQELSGTSSKHTYNAKRGCFDLPESKSKPNSSYRQPVPTRPSSFLSSLAASTSAASDASSRVPIERSSDFSSKPAVPSSSSFRKGKDRDVRVEEENRAIRMKHERRDEGQEEKEGQGSDAEWEKHGALGSTKPEEVKRRDDLTVLERLERGPREFGLGPEGDGNWQSVEPNSGIRLSKRILSHATLQDHFDGRFHVSPSLLYSVIRLSRDGTAYDLPLEGDWITIAVVAEQNGPIRTTKPGPQMADRENAVDEDGDENGGVGRGGRLKKNPPIGPRKFVSYKLVSLPQRGNNRSVSGSSISAGGDASINLLLFEADSETKSASTGKRTWRGGSGGAFEKFWNVKIGTVLAIMNPRVLRPLKNAKSPHPLTNVLAINPESVESITEIGFANDLGTCTARKVDGTRCSSWVDKRVSDICEYHIHTALKKARAGRAEFSSSTSSFAMGTRSANPRAASATSVAANARFAGGSVGGGSKSRDIHGKYDPVNRTGLLPRDTRESANSSSAYIVSGRTVQSTGSEYVGEKIGFQKASLLKRKREQRNAEEEILSLLGRDGGRTEGGRNLILAMGDETSGGGEAGEAPKRKSAFSAEDIRRIGFDPTLKGAGGVRREESIRETKERLAAIADLSGSKSKRELKLGPVPGQKKRSSVQIPAASSGRNATMIKRMRNLSSDDDDEDGDGGGDSDDSLEIEGAPGGER